MNKPIAPTFKNFQKDIENYLKSQNKCEKNEYGQIVFHGYYAAQTQIYRLYIQQGAIAPLVAVFRNWNWEWDYDDYLFELTTFLQKDGNWPLLKELWAGVVAKRRTNYNKNLKAHQAQPDEIPEERVEKTRELLLDSLNHLRSFATELNHESDMGDYLEMITKVEKRQRA